MKSTKAIAELVDGEIKETLPRFFLEPPVRKNIHDCTSRSNCTRTQHLFWRTTRPWRADVCRMEKVFPNNAVQYFVSYYNYYQPEAYVPTTDDTSKFKYQ